MKMILEYSEELGRQVSRVITGKEYEEHNNMLTNMYYEKKRIREIRQHNNTLEQRNRQFALHKTRQHLITKANAEE